MKESERIRLEVRAAADQLTLAQLELSRALGRQEAYRSDRWRRLLAMESLPDELRDATPQEAFLWSMRETDEQKAFWVRRRSAAFEREHARFRVARERLFSAEFEAGIARLREGDLGGAEYAIAYLEADPWHFHSGYLKEKYARWLRRVRLTDEQRGRLRHALLAAIQKGRREDLSEYVSLGRRVDSQDFRRRLSDLIETADEGTRYRAQRMLDACLLNDMPQK